MEKDSLNEIICPHCGKAITISPDAADQSLTCPDCGETIEPERTPCPFCQKPIMQGAVKCYHCDRIVDLKLKAQMANQGEERRYIDSGWLTGKEMLFAFLCAPVACIFSIIWICQGRVKQGLQMLLFLVFVSLAYSAINFLITTIRFTMETTNGRGL